MKRELKTKLTAALFGMLLLMTYASATQTGLSKRVRFPRGSTTATLKNSVVRGTLDRYTLGARAGQQMTVRITSLEDNAIFVIYKPGGDILEGTGEGPNEMSWNGELPQSGDYLIEVGGTRGNASYTLKVTVR